MFSLSKKPTIKEVQDLYREKKATVTEVVKYFFNRIENLDTKLKATVRNSEEIAKKIAKEQDLILEGGSFEDIINQQPLFGVPFVIKDNILVEGLETTSQSKILEQYIAVYSADIYNNLEKAGAILMAQGNMDEFAFGSSTEKSGFGQVTKNPHDTERVAGGTSGGPAVAVASGQAVFAIGTDTGGSVRQPSSFCGTVGMRPTYGLLSRYGIMASTSSFDQPGPISNSIKDNHTVLEAMRGATDEDQTNLEFRGKNTELKNTKKETFTIGIPKEYFEEGIYEAVKKQFEKLAEQLKKQGHTIKEVELESTKYNIATYYILQTVEAAANLERYDGIRYGKQVEEMKELFFDARESLLGDESKRRIMVGTYTSSAGYYDAYYNKACQAREKIRREWQKVLEDVDVIIGPVSPFPAFKISENMSDPLAMYLADIMTAPQSITRLPGLSVPIGNVEKEGSSLPVGAQVTGPELSEKTLYKVGQIIENLEL